MGDGRAGRPATGAAVVPSPTRMACQAINAAVAKRRKRASTSFVSSAPPAAPRAPGGAAHATAR